MVMLCSVLPELNLVSRMDELKRGLASFDILPNVDLKRTFHQ
jgi:hypothetical protein